MSLRIRHVRILVLLAPLALAACSSVPLSSSTDSVPASTRTASSRPASPLPALPPAGSGRGGYYMDDGPGDAPPEGLLDTPDAEPRVEPYSTRGNRPYVVFGKSYTPITDERPFKQRGIGSWYGKKFHGQKTSSGELYDMYKMTAAHPTLPIPSYARVTNLVNGKQVIVRVNDRGPFHSGRIIDLSYTAALKLGYLGKGSSQLEVERLLPEEIERIVAARKEQQAASNAEAVVLMPVVADGADIEKTPLALPEGTSGQPRIVTAPSAASSPGYYLQLGAYSKAENAEAARQRMMEGPAAKAAPMEVVEYDQFFRLYSGPFASRADAAAAAQQLQDSGIGKPMIVQR